METTLIFGMVNLFNGDGDGMDARWWHLFVRREASLEANVTTIFGDSAKPPDEALSIGLGFDPPHYYITSFDHEPDATDVEAALLDRLLDVLSEAS